MRFLMVDRICMLESGVRARGIKNTTWNDCFLQEHFAGMPVFSPVIAIETVAQLMSWLIIEHRNFTVKPVITVADSYTITRQILPGDQMELEGIIESWSPESVLARGSVCINGQEAISINHAVGFLYPLEDLNCPDEARRSFAQLYQPQQPAAGTPVRRHEPGGLAAPPAIRPLAWIDRLLPEEDPKYLRAVKNITNTEACFNDHFPRKPVLPGVMQIESMCELGRLLAAKQLQQHGIAGKRPILSSLNKIKFRKFVTPGDQLHIEARLEECTPDSSRVALKALVNGHAAGSSRAQFVHLDQGEYVQRYIA